MSWFDRRESGRSLGFGFGFGLGRYNPSLRPYCDRSRARGGDFHGGAVYGVEDSRCLIPILIPARLTPRLRIELELLVENGCVWAAEAGQDDHRLVVEEVESTVHPALWSVSQNTAAAVVVALEDRLATVASAAEERTANTTAVAYWRREVCCTAVAAMEVAAVESVAAAMVVVEAGAQWVDIH